MFMQALKVLALVATVVGSIYAVFSFYRPTEATRTAQAANPTPNRVETTDVASRKDNSPTPPASIGRGTQIEQSSTGSKSPSIVSGGNVNIEIK